MYVIDVVIREDGAVDRVPYHLKITAESFVVEGGPSHGSGDPGNEIIIVRSYGVQNVEEQFERKRRGKDGN
jgi:hypothetical protein